jgi:hypothetical protein
MHTLQNEAEADFAGQRARAGDPRAAMPGSAHASGGISAEQRRQMIATAAHRRYEQRANASGDAVTDWLEAEKEVDSLLSEHGAAGSAESAKSVFLRALSTVLGECQAQLEDLGAKAKAANAALRRKYDPQIALAVAKYEAARGKFVEVREHTDGAWGHLKDGAEKAALEMRIAVRELASLIK